MVRILELFVRIAVLVIFLYVRSEGFTRFLNEEAVSTIGTVLIIGVLFWVKFRSDEKLKEVYSNIKYAIPLGNTYLMVALLWSAYNVNYINTNLSLVIVGLVLLTILQVIDLLFLKLLKRRLNLK